MVSNLLTLVGIVFLFAGAIILALRAFEKKGTEERGGEVVRYVIPSKRKGFLTIGIIFLTVGFVLEVIGQLLRWVF